VAITGASGFVGGSVLLHLARRGYHCVSLGRRPVHQDVAIHRHFELGGEVDPSAFAGVEVLVHCAWDMQIKSAAAIYSRNVVGTANLLRAATRAGVERIVFISSMSAYEGTRQVYGRAKLEGEQLTDELGGVSLRLGLVWGADAGGMAAAVQKLTALPVVPVLGRSSHQFTVHRDDVVAAIEAAIRDRSITGVLGVANPAAVETPRLLDGLAQLAGQRPIRRRLPIPWRPVYYAMRAAEAARLPLPLRADSVLGLVQPAACSPGAPEWAARGVRFRPFPERDPDPGGN
jgi:nucleoside-diphosphate-sugar epimerase